MRGSDWKAYESTLLEAATVAATALLDKRRGAFYAMAFHEFYAEAGDHIALPCLAAHTEERLAGDESSRWSSPDWHWTDIKYQNRALRHLHRVLDREAMEQEMAAWEATYARLVEAFVRVAKQLSRKLAKHPRAGKDFGVFVFTDADDSARVLQRCMTPKKFKRLFPDLEEELAGRRQLEASADDVKLARYRRDIRQHHDDILRLGDKAIPMLLEALQDDGQAWAAADLLGKHGNANPEVIETLRRRASAGHETRFHEAGALALLGDIDFLLKLAESAKAAEVAVRGIALRTSCAASDCQRDIPLDYRPIEALLEIPAAKKQAARELNETSSIDIVPSDVEEALRGLGSKHVAVRVHACGVLGERRLGKKAGERVLPELAGCLQDRSATVRRLAIVALSGWKKAARPWVGEIRKRFKDPSDSVATTARHYAKEIGR